VNRTARIAHKAVDGQVSKSKINEKIKTKMEK
jgi:hypothetical protein